VGPVACAGMRCPACAGQLGSWGGYRRRVRVGRATFRLLVRRARCGACERTHALLPGFLLARRLDMVDVIGCALEMAAGGRGYRPIAAALGRTGTTVRSWLRRLRARADVCAAGSWVWRPRWRRHRHDRRLAARRWGSWWERSLTRSWRPGCDWGRGPCSAACGRSVRRRRPAACWPTRACSRRERRSAGGWGVVSFRALGGADG